MTLISTCSSSLTAEASRLRLLAVLGRDREQQRAAHQRAVERVERARSRRAPRRRARRASRRTGWRRSPRGCRTGRIGRASPVRAVGGGCIGPVSLPDADSIGPMIRGIDHLVIACADPDAAARTSSPRSAWPAPAAVATRARHRSTGSLAGGRVLPRAHRGDRPRCGAVSRSGPPRCEPSTRLGGGLATYALRVDDLDLTVGAAGGGLFVRPSDLRQPHPRRWRGRRVVDVGARGAARPERPRSSSSTPTGCRVGPGGARGPRRGSCTRSARRSASRGSTSPERPTRRRGGRSTASSGSTSGPSPTSRWPTSGRTSSGSSRAARWRCRWSSRSARRSRPPDGRPPRIRFDVERVELPVPEPYPA